MSWFDDPVNRATACHMCGGFGYVEPSETSYEETLDERCPCPMCAAPMHGTTAYDVRWNSEAKVFEVALAFPLPDGASTSPELVALFPELIAQRSRCSCGSSLKAGDHDVSLSDNHGTFRGSFHCQRCRDSGGGALAVIRKSIGSVWRQIVRIKVGPTGVEFEKSSD
jgi:hypothetical protein